jgi:L-ascorbate metabolism protein UlaG (beta-lactamase superfamily)
MQIEYLGERAFKIKTKTMTVLVDPALEVKKQATDIVVGSDVNVSGPVKRDSVFVIDRPGEYEIGGVEINTIPVSDDLVTVMHAEDITLVHLGGVCELSEKRMEELSTVEVLMMPIGAKKDVLNKLSPLILIPMDYKNGADIDKFVAESGFEKTERVEKLTLKESDLPDDMQVVIMG